MLFIHLPKENLKLKEVAEPIEQEEEVLTEEMIFLEEMNEVQTDLHRQSEIIRLTQQKLGQAGMLYVEGTTEGKQRDLAEVLAKDIYAEAKELRDALLSLGGDDA